MERKYIVASAVSFTLSVALAVLPITASASSMFQADGNGSATSSAHIERLVSDSPYSIPRSSSAPSSNGISLMAEDALPSSYDLRSLGLSTSVKHQGEFGTCWAFSSIASFESALLKQRGGSWQSMDLSELQVAYFQNWQATQAEAETLGASGQAGEGVLYTRSGNPLSIGGNAAMVASIISRGTGVVSESRAPYRNAEGSMESYDVTDWSGADAVESYWSSDGSWDISRSLVSASEYQLAEAGYGLVDTISAPGIGQVADTSYVSEMKNAIMDNGAVAISLAHPIAGAAYDWDKLVDEYTNTATGARFVNKASPSNHMVAVVGWDDSFSKSNFTIEPPSDGAWIVKNSYGSAFSDEGNVSAWGVEGSGYFYLSYYDATISDFSWMLPVSAQDETSITMQYDLLGFSGGDTFLISFEEETPFANVFTADCDMQLEAVSAASPDPGMSADVYIYLLSDTSASPEDGELLASAHKDIGDLMYSRINLAEPLSIKAGETFSVVEYLHGELAAAGSGESWVTSFEVGYEDGYTDASGLYCKAVANEGESFIRMDGEWYPSSALDEDSYMRQSPYEVGNAMIKAFGNPADLSGWTRPDSTGLEGGGVDERSEEDASGTSGSSGSSGDNSGTEAGGSYAGQVSEHPLTGSDNVIPTSYSSGNGSVQTSPVTQGGSSSVVASDPKLAQTGDSLPNALILFSALCAMSSACFIFAGLRRERL